MITFLQVVHVLVCILLIAIVLIQSGKGQGLAGAFGSVAGDTAQSFFGARTGDVLTRGTTYLAITFFGLAIILAMLQARESRSVFTRVGEPVAVETVTQPEDAFDLPRLVIDDQPVTDEPLVPAAELPHEGVQPEAAPQTETIPQEDQAETGNEDSETATPAA